MATRANNNRWYRARNYASFPQSHSPLASEVRRKPYERAACLLFQRLFAGEGELGLIHVEVE